MDELPQVDVVCLGEIKHCKEALADDAWQVGVGEQGDLVDTFVFIVTLGYQVLVNVLEVGHSNILFEFLVLENCVIHKFDFLCSVLHI